jgi:hypothetical protein
LHGTISCAGIDAAVGVSIERRGLLVAGKSWYGKSWVGATAAVALVIALVVAALVSGGKDTTPSRTTTAAASHAAKKPSAADLSADALKKDATAQDRAAAREDQASGASGVKAAPSGTWVLGSVGTYLVGRGIRPGTYRSAGPTSGVCHWARLKGLSSAHADTIVNRAATGSSTVTIKATDKFFSTSNCENWLKIH